MTIQAAYQSMIDAGEITTDPAQVAVLPEFERIRAALETPVKRGFFRRAPEAPRGLYLWGGVGRGKSMLMDMFAREAGEGVRRIHFHEFMQTVHAELHLERKNGTDDALTPVANRIARDLRCLALDEMQITDITDAMIVGRLFQQLFDQGICVVTTSNRVPDDLYKDGLNRQLFLPFIALLKDRMIVHELVAEKDYRQDRLSGETVYFSPANAEARQALDKIWQDLTGGRGAPLRLSVNKRDVMLPAFRNGIGRASFHGLCGQPLGAADYLAIADAVRVLILDDIPQLGRSNFNEARRFVTLVDALYEARVRLIASAAAAPEMLYVEGEGTFEFERTASRLREMMSADWASPAT